MDIRRKAVVLVSGGMDSLVALAIARTGFDTAALHVRYGQRTGERELQAYRDICDHYGLKERLVCTVDALRQIGGSSLTDTSLPVADAEEPAAGIPASYVPFRNAHFLSIAVSWAEVLGAGAVFIGAVEEDSSGYPDCRKVFYDAFSKAVEAGTKPGTRIEINIPVIHMTKKDIILKGTGLNAPFHLTWSCYRNEERACGTCDSCTLRLRAFRQAGKTDPIDYITRPDY
ncbi:7-cyano-7-deazaguanine synthase QueC [candidate division KSB1 bacterium]